jgi:hypothetical protein
MVHCRYFIQGKCNKGSKCEFEHPGEATLANGGTITPPLQGGFGHSFGAHSSARGNHSPFFSPSLRGGRGGHFRQNPTNSNSHRSNIGQASGATISSEVKPEDVILHDLKDVNIEWPLSCYGLNRDWESGDNILTVDFSPEELRMEAYAQIRTCGNIDGYIASLAHALEAQRQAIAELLADPSRAVARARTPRAYRLAATSTQNTASHVESNVLSKSDEVSQIQPQSNFSFGTIPEVPQ